jgi:hypothetical protein
VLGKFLGTAKTASVARRRGCKIWSAFFRDLDGRQRCRSTGIDIKGLALRIAQEYEQAARQKKTLRQIQRTLEGFREMLTGEVTPRATLRQFAEGWLSTKQYETAPGTFKFYTESVRKLFCHLRAELPISEVTRNQILAYRSALAAKGLASTAVNHHLEAAKMLFKAARRDGLIADDPSEFVAALKTATQSKRPFKLEELRAVLEVADPEWRYPNAPLHPRASCFLEAHGRTGGLSTQFTKLLAQAGLRPYQPRTKLASSPVVLYAGLFVCVDIAYNVFEHQVLARADVTQVSARVRRLARRRSLIVLAGFTTAMLVAFVAPRLGFGLICAALILHLRPEVPGFTNR